jgi:hypothetical protein
VLSDAAAKAGLSCTLFERLQRSLGDGASSMLTVQYRMHSNIMDWSSQELYEVRAGRGAPCHCSMGCLYGFMCSQLDHLRRSCQMVQGCCGGYQLSHLVASLDTPTYMMQRYTASSSKQKQRTCWLLLCSCRSGT